MRRIILLSPVVCLAILYFFPHYHIDVKIKKKKSLNMKCILSNDQLDALFVNVFIYASTCFEQQVLIIRRSKLY
jgi:hypothetical protein